MFTTNIGTFKNYLGSRVFISKAEYEPVGRARSFIKPRTWKSEKLYFNPVFKTKAYPISRNSIQIVIDYSPSIYSEGVIKNNELTQPNSSNALDGSILQF